jgi:hypothetical protein
LPRSLLILAADFLAIDVDSLKPQKESNPIMNDTATSERPVAITVICVLGFIGAAFTIPLIFSDIARGVGAWYPPYLALSAVVGFVCMIGLWKMMKWAVFAYTAFCVLNQVVLMAMGVWNIFALVIPAIVIAIAFAYLSKMK